MNSNLSFEKCKWDSIKHLFLNYHYLKTMPAGILQCYGLFDIDKLGMAVGGAVFCNGRIQYEGTYIEFSRMFMYDFLPKNTESSFISKCIKDLKKTYAKYKGVVTWADCSRGHNGTIYLASNFVFDGQSRKVKKFTGKNKKVIYQRTATSDDICIGFDEPKKRFIYYFDNKKRELLKNETTHTNTTNQDPQTGI